MKYVFFCVFFLKLFFLAPLFCQTNNFLLPFLTKDRTSIESAHLTQIGAFGIVRKPRPGIPAHLHTGIDIQRPGENYIDEPIFSIMTGKVISMRDDGPYAQIIIEHEIKNREKFWTVYEHVSGIRVTVGDSVTPIEPIARFMNKEELDRHGWQFDHLHFEILKVKPYPVMPTEDTPYRYFRSYNLECYTQTDLKNYYFDPIQFLKEHVK
jgi:murein DD-endopeptidase MepM/ murein hydrolase activator NlpD